MRRGLLMLCLALMLVAWHPLAGNRGLVSGQTSPAQALTVAPANRDALLDWSNSINSMLRSDQLQVRRNATTPCFLAGPSSSSINTRGGFPSGGPASAGNSKAQTSSRFLECSTRTRQLT